MTVDQPDTEASEIGTALDGLCDVFMRAALAELEQELTTEEQKEAQS